MVDQGTIGKVADATEEIAKTKDTALKLVGKFGTVFMRALNMAGSILENEFKFLAARRALRPSGKWEAFMDARGLDAPAR
jgi:hypothetical protein